MCADLRVLFSSSLPALCVVPSQNGLHNGWFSQPSIVVVSVLGVWGAACASWHCSQTLRTHISKQLLTKIKIRLSCTAHKYFQILGTSPQNCSHSTQVTHGGSDLIYSQEPLFRVRSLSLSGPQFLLSYLEVMMPPL